ncbi:MAG: oxygenase MpaB family protein [Bacteroidota bacterium]
MEYFVDEDSIVREIWGKGDTILFIFAGASAEFALNKAVDWLYYTGRLPNDPLGRLFSTVSYARKIVFSEKDAALKAIDSIAAIHSAVESKRGRSIPDWAYRDVLFMLIDYSIRSYELLEHKLSLAQKQEVFNVFFRVGNRMQLQGLPENFEAFQKMRRSHLEQNLEAGVYTRDLYRRYRKHLGPFRYRLLLETQIYITPEKVRKLLSLRKFSLLTLLIPPYKLSRRIKLDRVLRSVILPAAYREEINSLDQVRK